MDILGFLIPAALLLGALGLAAFIWSMRSGQFDDLDGAAMRILLEDEDALPEDSRAGEANAPRNAGDGQPTPTIRP